MVAGAAGGESGEWLGWNGGSFWSDDNVWDPNSSVYITIPNVLSLNYLF